MSARPLTVARPGDGVARVTLARPEVRNAFNAELIAELTATFTNLAAEPPERLRAVVLAGEGRSFCAGADIAWMQASLELSVEENEADARRLAEMLAVIDACPVPVVARVHGAALGGGMGLCAVADIVLAMADATFAFSETKLGILPATIAPFVLAKIGESAARALFPTGERFGAERARTIGLVHEVLPDEAALDARVGALLAEVLSAGPTATRAAKAVIRELRGLPAEQARSLTVRRIAAQRTSAEGQEGLTAFLEKRQPAWRG
jgi:methylglutaconyl-CoA hydratase